MRKLYREVNHYQRVNKKCYPPNPNYIKDYGNQPFVVNMQTIARQNNTFRTALWTGEHLQITLMKLMPGECIGLEIHNNLDQFIMLEQGVGLVQMGKMKNNLELQQKVYDNCAFVIPAGTWHNLTNIGNLPIKLFSIYAPPQHPKGTVHCTKADAKD